MTAEWIGHIDQPSPDVLSTLVARELPDLALLRLPLVLCVQHETLENLSSVLAQAAHQELREGDLPAESADVLQATHAEARVDDEILLVPYEGLRLDEQVVVPVRQGGPRAAEQTRRLKLCAGPRAALRSTGRG